MAKQNKRNRKTADTESKPAWRGRDWIWALALALGVFVVYTQVWWAGFNWDDNLVFTANPVIVGPMGLKEIWTTNAADICPLTLTTFWIEHALWGLNPLPYHLVNVLLHAADAIVLWRVLRLLAIPGAWLGAALWALHPVQVESVAWIAEMKNTESALFYLLAILFFLRCLGVPQRKGNYALALIFAALAMASKSSTIVLPLVLVLAAWWKQGRWDWHTVLRVAPVLFLSAATGLVTLWTQGLYFAAHSNTVNMPCWQERLAIAGDVVWFYLGKLAWPDPLMAVYPRWQIDELTWMSYLPSVAAIAVLMVFWFYRRSWTRAWFFAYAYFLVALVPVMGLALNTYFNLSFVADHFQYLAAMGPMALAGAGMVRLADRIAPGEWWPGLSIGAGVLLVLGVVSGERAGVYQSEEILWTDTLQKNPACWLGHNNLGNLLHHEGRIEEAVAHLEEALKLMPDFADAHANVANIYFQLGRLDEAQAHYQAALRSDPDFPNAHYNFGLLLSQQGRQAEAIEHFQRALELNPNFPEAHNGLGIAYVRANRIADAIVQFQAALQERPGYDDAQKNLARMESLGTPAAK
jgi:hypothetical protein